MKQHNGFVSNSSTSSFIIYKDKLDEEEVEFAQSLIRFLQGTNKISDISETLGTFAINCDRSCEQIFDILFDDAITHVSEW